MDAEKQKRPTRLEHTEGAEGEGTHDGIPSTFEVPSAKGYLGVSEIQGKRAHSGHLRAGISGDDVLDASLPEQVIGVSIEPEESLEEAMQHEEQEPTGSVEPERHLPE